MSPTRILIVLGVVGGFAAGIGLALYFTGALSPDGPAATTPASATAGHAPGSIASSSTPGSDPSAENSGGPALTGQALVDKFWEAMTIPDEAERQRTWLSMLKKLNKEDAAEVRALFKKMDKQGRWMVPEWAAFWPRWGALDGAAAWDSVEKNEGEKWKPHFAEMILRGWAQGDTDAAIQWLRDNRDKPAYGSGVRAFVDGLAKKDLDRATQFVLSEKPEDIQGHLGTLMESLAERALQQRLVGGMTDWFSQLPPSPAKTAAMEAVAFRLGRADTNRAMDWVAEQAKQPWRSDKSISELASTVSQGEPQKALEWASKLPPSPTTGRYNGLNKAVERLAAKDPAAVETWLAQPNRNPVLQDQATAAYATQLMKSGNPTWSTWAERVTDKKWLKTETTVPISPEGKSLRNGWSERIESSKQKK